MEIITVLAFLSMTDRVSVHQRYNNKEYSLLNSLVERGPIRPTGTRMLGPLEEGSADALSKSPVGLFERMKRITIQDLARPHSP